MALRMHIFDTLLEEMSATRGDQSAPSKVQSEHWYVLPIWKRSAYLDLNNLYWVATLNRRAGSMHDVT